MRKLKLIAFMLMILLFSNCKKNHEVRHTIQYTIASKGNMHVSYSNTKGEILSEPNVSSAWTYSFNVPGDGRIVKLIITSWDGNPVSGGIYIDGQEVAIIDSYSESVTITAQLPSQ